MPIQINQLTQGRHSVRATLKFEQDGEQRSEAIEVTYNTITPKVFDELSSSSESKDDIVRQLALIEVQSGDIVNADGKPEVLTKELLEKFSIFNLQAILQAIIGAVLPNEKRSETTAATS